MQIKKVTFFLIAFAFFGILNAPGTNFAINHIALSFKNLDE